MRPWEISIGQTPSLAVGARTVTCNPTRLAPALTRTGSNTTDLRSAERCAWRSASFRKKRASEALAGIEGVRHHIDGAHAVLLGADGGVEAPGLAGGGRAHRQAHAAFLRP